MRELNETVRHAAVAAHPAKFSGSIIEVLQAQVDMHGPVRIFDPFAGVGRVHWLTGTHTVGVELEPEWARVDDRTLVGNALALPFPTASFDGLATSPCYGNRMADHHNARDSSKRNTYRHVLGRPLHNDNSGVIQWGEDYRDFHHCAWTEAVRVLTSDALVLLNASNHIRKGREQPVAEWHLQWWLAHDFKLFDAITVQTPRQRHGANGVLRVGWEWVFVLRGLSSATTLRERGI